ncbi:hypothetical protein XENOCAPTIV_019624 [Xenoophorus captivus]|uniref:protein-tyrosine-phosphatase n=1 Tax=Xenoophorus captivus TaxID=1517983 RepID=A0ABV0RL78_9TELE
MIISIGDENKEEGVLMIGQSRETGILPRSQSVHCCSLFLQRLDKCYQYWPDQGCWTYGNARVAVEDCTVLVDYTIRKFCVQHPVMLLRLPVWSHSFTSPAGLTLEFLSPPLACSKQMVDVYGFVSKIREQRSQLIQTDGYRQKDYFIATQGPLLHTVADFWRMVWEWKCHSIVMLTELQEREQVIHESNSLKTLQINTKLNLYFY